MIKSISSPVALLGSYRRYSLWCAVVAAAFFGADVFAQARPNLVPRDVAMGTYSARPGEQISVSWTMANTGTGHCLASFTGIYLSTSLSSPPASSLLNTFVTPEIPANSSVQQAFTVTLPFDLPTGNYYLYVRADDVPSSSLNQTSRADDLARSLYPLQIGATRLQPNLLPRDVTLSASMVRPGDQLTVIWTTTNIGAATCPRSVTGLRLGTSSTAPPNSASLVQVATPEIPSRGGIKQTNVLTIPPGLALGTYYVWVVVDDFTVSTLNQVSRGDDTAKSAQFGVVAVLAQPNLVPMNIQLDKLEARRSDQVTVTWAITNKGNANCAASITGVHLSNSATVPPTSDPVNAKIATPALAAGASVAQSHTFTIPAGAALGNYYVWIVADDVASSTLNQSTREDDAERSPALAVVQVLRQPNLVPQNLVVNPTTLRPGDSLTFSWRMTNSGNANCPASVTALRLGTSATVAPTTSGINILIPTPEIKTNASFAQTNSITIPANTALGTYYLWVIADAEDDALNQSSKADDAKASGAISVVSALPKPNLVPMNVSASRQLLRPGEQLTVNWTMTNSGNANCAASVTGLHLGTSATTPPTSDSLNVSVPTAAINANAAIQQSSVVTVPANTPMGTYYIWVLADDVPNSTLGQSSEADDAARTGSFLVTTVTLTSPAAAATVDAPPTFTWNAAGVTNPKIYLAAKAAPVLGTDKLVVLDLPAGSSTFRPSAAAWASAVNTLGVAASYYWTIGSGDAANRAIYAEWRGFKVIPTVTGGSIVGSNDFRFQIVAPQQTAVVVQASTNLETWLDIETVQNTAGTVVFTDDSGDAPDGRFYRIKP
jgi:uncharacterized membrane protein